MTFIIPVNIRKGLDILLFILLDYGANDHR
jgi:hypothetical protein